MVKVDIFDLEPASAQRRVHTLPPTCMEPMDPLSKGGGLCSPPPGFHVSFGEGAVLGWTALQCNQHQRAHHHQSNLSKRDMGLYRDNGKENGNYYLRFRVEYEI